eukprot:97576-Rhodomonas_salina.1
MQHFPTVLNGHLSEVSNGLNRRLARQEELKGALSRWGPDPPIGLRACYEKSGTDIAYAAT